VTGTFQDDAGWVERDVASVWHGFTQMAWYDRNEPVIVERAEGRELIAVDGRRYLDAISSLWVTTLGHRVPELDAALRDQLDRVAHTTMLGNGNRVVIELAEALATVVPVERPRFLFAADGASAVEQAIKVAFQHHVNLGAPRATYLAFGGGYHGDTIGSLSVGAAGFGTEIFDPLRFPVLRAPGFDDPDCIPAACRMVAEHAGRLAAVVVEPVVQGAAGMQLQPPERFAALADACRTHGVLLVCDEVATGFGRTGTLFASEQCGIRPDVLCLGKGITGGYLPMSATVVSEAVWSSFLGDDPGPRTFHHGHSYGGNALAAAVALRHLELLADGTVLANVRERAAQLAAGLAEHVVPSPLVHGVRQHGLMAAVVLHDGGERRPRRAAAACVRRGVLIRSMGDVLTIVPPLTTTADEIDRIVQTVAAALAEVAGDDGVGAAAVGAVGASTHVVTVGRSRGDLG
jgi:adenosylmethionine---8-amino-7-oxononanoate aminotransferase